MVGLRSKKGQDELLAKFGELYERVYEETVEGLKIWLKTTDREPLEGVDASSMTAIAAGLMDGMAMRYAVDPRKDIAEIWPVALVALALGLTSPEGRRVRRMTSFGRLRTI